MTNFVMKIARDLRFSPLETARVIVGTRNNPNLLKELIRRNPFMKNRETNEENLANH